MSNAQSVLRVDEAADYLGLSKSQLNKLRCQGGGPAYLKLGAAVRYDKSALDAWLASKLRTSTSQQIAA